MSRNNSLSGKRQQILEKLRWSGRKESRNSLLFRHLIAEKAGLHVTDAECIDFLLEAKSATAGELAKATGLTSGAMTAAIDRLEEVGFVVRERDIQDRRRVFVKPVMKKIKKFIPHYNSLTEEVDKLFSKYPLKELEFLLKHQQCMVEIYEKEISKLQNEENENNHSVRTQQ